MRTSCTCPDEAGLHTPGPRHPLGQPDRLGQGLLPAARLWAYDPAAACDRLGARRVTEVLRKCRRRMSRTRARLRPWREHGHNGPYLSEENMMAKYLLLKHYRGAPASVNDVPMDQWTPEELSAHVQYMQDFAARLEGTGEFVDR